MALGVLLLIAGLWLLLQTLAGDLPRRILSWRGGGGGGDADAPMELAPGPFPGDAKAHAEGAMTS